MIRSEINPIEEAQVRCDLCGSEQVREVVRLSAPSLSTDGRLYPFPLRKVVCTTCGLIRTAGAIPKGLIETHYGEGYRLGQIGAAAEPVFFVNGGKVPASLSMLEWIVKLHTACELSVPETLLEVGCGNGSLLSRLKNRWPETRVLGIDLDAVAVESACKKALDAQVGSLEDVSGKFDLIVSVAVIEHVPSPVEFLKQVRSRLSSDGAAVIVLPVQDRGNRDIFFWDHLFHFHTQHVPALAAKAGFRLVCQDANYPLQVGFAMNVLTPVAEIGDIGIPGDARNQRVGEVVEKWNGIFERLNDWLDKNSGRKLSIFGLGETFDLLFAYSCLKSVDIAEGLDENVDRAKARGNTFPVNRPTADTLGNVECLLVTFEPPSSLRETLDRLQIPIFYLGET